MTNGPSFGKTAKSPDFRTHIQSHPTSARGTLRAISSSTYLQSFLLLLDSRRPSRSVPKTQDENAIRFANRFVDDPIGSMSNLANCRVTQFSNDLAHQRKRSYGESLIDENIAELASALLTVLCDVRDDLSKILL
jgi:hypothetical protein